MQIKIYFLRVEGFVFRLVFHLTQIDPIFCLSYCTPDISKFYLKPYRNREYRSQLQIYQRKVVSSLFWSSIFQIGAARGSVDGLSNIITTLLSKSVLTVLPMLFYRNPRVSKVKFRGVISIYSMVINITTLRFSLSIPYWMQEESKY